VFQTRFDHDQGAETHFAKLIPVQKNPLRWAEKKARFFGTKMIGDFPRHGESSMNAVQ